MDIKHLKDAIAKFSDENVCREYLIKQRWNGKPHCPRCKCEKVYNIEKGKRFECTNKECNLKFSVTTGTMMENTKLPLSTWFYTILHALANKKGITAHQLSRDTGISLRAAWFMIHRIRRATKETNPLLLIDEVQVDEAFVGGKNKNRHKNKKIKGSQGRSHKDKTTVVGFYEQPSTKVITRVVPNANATTLIPLMLDTIGDNTIVVTDAYRGYNSVNKHWKHVVVKHRQHLLLRFHTNGIENFWSHLKRGIIGLYHSASKKHMQSYCDEYAFRYNTRNMTDMERFEYFFSLIECRLTYNELIGKN